MQNERFIFNEWRQKSRASILIVLVEISEEETKGQQYFSW